MQEYTKHTIKLNVILKKVEAGRSGQAAPRGGADRALGRRIAPLSKRGRQATPWPRRYSNVAQLPRVLTSCRQWTRHGVIVVTRKG